MLAPTDRVSFRIGRKRTCVGKKYPLSQRAPRLRISAMRCYVSVGVAFILLLGALSAEADDLAVLQAIKASYPKSSGIGTPHPFDSDSHQHR